MATISAALAVRTDCFPLNAPFRISRGVKTIAEVLSVVILRNGVVGRGECVPYARYGESLSSTTATIESIREEIERGVTRRELLSLLPAGAARNAVDCALWDLELREGRAAARARPVATAMTVSLDTPERMAEAATLLADAPLVKVKVDRENPAEALRAVRKAAPGPRLIVDPNESWTIADVDALQGLMTDLRVDLLEQPLPADADGDLAGYRSAIPIAADESIHVAEDLETLPDGYSVVNIKLDKTGGRTAALALAEAARARGLGVMTGCMISSSLSIAPAWTIAERADFVDLDGPLWLAKDREGGVRGTKGLLAPPQAGFWGDF